MQSNDDGGAKITTKTTNDVNGKCDCVKRNENKKYVSATNNMFMCVSVSVTFFCFAFFVAVVVVVSRFVSFQCICVGFNVCLRVRN